MGTRIMDARGKGMGKLPEQAAWFKSVEFGVGDDVCIIHRYSARGKYAGMTECVKVRWLNPNGLWTVREWHKTGKHWRCWQVKPADIYGTV